LSSLSLLSLLGAFGRSILARTLGRLFARLARSFGGGLLGSFRAFGRSVRDGALGRLFASAGFDGSFRGFDRSFLSWSLFAR
jgi:hypothetical protein